MRKPVLYIVGLLLVHAALLSIFAAFRLADADEGVYLNATRMVHMGMKPYVDFFYTQLSMMPTVFAVFGGGGWESFFMLRGFGVLAGILAAVLFTLIVFRLTKDSKAAVAALFLYALSGMFICWHSTYKALPFCHFLSLATFYFWLRYHDDHSLLNLIMTGLFLSALINFRSVFIILLPLYIISVVIISRQNRLKNTAVFMAALVPPSIPTLVQMLDSVSHFLYGNLFFQMYRSGDNSLSAIIGNRLDVLLSALSDPQLIIVLIMTLLAVLMILRRRSLAKVSDLFTKPQGMILMNLFLIWGIYLLPHPMSRQYIDQYLAFALLLFAVNFVEIKKYFGGFLTAHFMKNITAAVVVVYVLALIPYIAVFTFGIRDFDKRFTLPSIRGITTAMADNALEADTILTEWPGYSFITKQVPLRYTEIIGHDFYLPMTSEEYRKYNLCDESYLRGEVGKKTPKLVVNVIKTPEYYADVLENNYDLAYEAERVSIYKRR